MSNTTLPPHAAATTSPRAADVLEVVPSGRPAGAEIRGGDLTQGASDAVSAQIRDGLHRFKVVVLRGQHLKPEQQIAFSRAFGLLERHVISQFLVPGHEELVRVFNILDDGGKPIGLVDAGRAWHTDGHFLSRPNLYSMLYAIEIPHDRSGQSLGATLFANTAHAYRQLPLEMKRRLVGLRELVGARLCAYAWRWRRAQPAFAIRGTETRGAASRCARAPVHRRALPVSEPCRYRTHRGPRPAGERGPDRRIRRLVRERGIRSHAPLGRERPSAVGQLQQPALALGLCSALSPPAASDDRCQGGDRLMPGQPDRI